jgi:hypothetical protein
MDPETLLALLNERKNFLLQDIDARTRALDNIEYEANKHILYVET